MEIAQTASTFFIRASTPVAEAISNTLPPAVKIVVTILAVGVVAYAGKRLYERCSRSDPTADQIETAAFLAAFRLHMAREAAQSQSAASGERKTEAPHTTASDSVLASLYPEFFEPSFFVAEPIPEGRPRRQYAV